MKRSAPLRRTGFKRPEPKPFALADRQTTLKRTAMKSRIKKPTVEQGSKYLAACRGERCFLGVICGGDASPDIVMPCHSNQARDGKGMGKKALHEKTVPGCHWCHQWLDAGKASREEKFATWDRAYGEWKFVRDGKMEAEAA
jgi:hypothetical protein